MANIKVGDIVQITSGVLSGTVSVVSDVVRGRGACGTDLYFLSVPSLSLWDIWYHENEFHKIEG